MLRVGRGAEQAPDPSADVHLVSLQQRTHFSLPCQWAIVLDDVLGRAVDSYALRTSLRELLGHVDAACVCVDMQALAARFSALLCLEPSAAASNPQVSAEEEGTATDAAPANMTDETLFGVLRVWRRDEARRRSVPAYRVMSDRVLRQVCAEKPADLATLAVIPGIGEKTIEKSGAALLAALRSHR